MVREQVESFRSGGFWEIVSTPRHAETGEPPRGHRGDGCMRRVRGGGEGCRGVGVTKMFTHGVGPLNPAVQLRATQPRLSAMHTDSLLHHRRRQRHTWICVCVCVCLRYNPWLEATSREGEAFPDRVLPSGIPASGLGQTLIPPRLKAWKNGDHLTRKRQDFWKPLTSPSPPNRPLPPPTITTAARWTLHWRRPARTGATQRGYWQTYGNNLA